jgi:ribosomal protein L15E
MVEEFKLYEIRLRLWEKGWRLRVRQVEDDLWEARISSWRFGGPATTVYGPTRLDAARWAWVTSKPQPKAA